MIYPRANFRHFGEATKLFRMLSNILPSPKCGKCRQNAVCHRFYCGYAPAVNVGARFVSTSTRKALRVGIVAPG